MIKKEVKNKKLLDKKKDELIKELRIKNRELKNIQKQNRKKQGARTFKNVLSIISIVGFIGIISETLFYLNLTEYVKFAWMTIMGIGLFIEADSWKLIKKIQQNGFEGENFHRLVTATVGTLATIIGILTFPIWNITSPGFLAIKGTISIIAVLYIIIQTWFIR